MIHEISKQNSVLNHFIREIRDVNVQNDRLRFRKNMERISQILSYELSKSLDFKPVSIQTPLSSTNSETIDEQVVIGSILRAGLSMHEGVLSFFDQADNAFISAYRQESDESREVKVIVEYMAAPNLDNKTLILVDPMLATGTSLILTIEALKSRGQVKKLHIMTAIASQEGIERVQNEFPEADIWAAAIDPELDKKSYIVPGLGDAGDLAYGEKE